MHLCVLAETEPIRFDTDSDSKPVAKGGRPSMYTRHCPAGAMCATPRHAFALHDEGGTWTISPGCAALPCASSPCPFHSACGRIINDRIPLLEDTHTSHYCSRCYEALQPNVACTHFRLFSQVAYDKCGLLLCCTHCATSAHRRIALALIMTGPHTAVATEKSRKHVCTACWPGLAACTVILPCTGTPMSLHVSISEGRLYACHPLARTAFRLNALS